MGEEENDRLDLGTQESIKFMKQPLLILRIAFAIYSVLIFLVPIYNGSDWGIDSKLNFICWLIMGACCLSCHGRFVDFLALFPVITLRTIFIIYSIFMNKGAVNYIFLAIIMVVEFVLNILYMSDKSTYTYIIEEEKHYELY